MLKEARTGVGGRLLHVDDRGVPETIRSMWYSMEVTRGHWL